LQYASACRGHGNVVHEDNTAEDLSMRGTNSLLTFTAEKLVTLDSPHGRVAAEEQL
jgi:hypothetical protein